MSQAPRRPQWWSMQAASAWLGGAVLVLAMLETVWGKGLGPFLPHSAILTAGHWTIGAVLLVGALAHGATVRALLLASGAVLLAAGLVGLLAAGAVGDALGLGRAVPVPAPVLSLALGAVSGASCLLPDRVEGRGSEPPSDTIAP